MRITPLLTLAPTLPLPLPPSSLQHDAPEAHETLTSLEQEGVYGRVHTATNLSGKKDGGGVKRASWLEKSYLRTFAASTAAENGVKG